MNQNEPITPNILFIGKADDHCSQMAADFIKLHFPGSRIVYSKRGLPMPGDLMEWQGDLLISYLAQWIIPGKLLSKAKMAAINFHTGPPAYPGIGCTNFALYNGETEFGITCHHMLEKVDSGPIIAVRRFPVFPKDTVFSMTQRCYAEIWHLFYELMSGLLKGQPLPLSTETWTRKPFTRKQLDDLCELKPDMSPEEKNRRIRATTYGDKVWAFVREGDQKVSYSSDMK
jgi:methionyl-tRNA formyltransferase